MLVFQNNPDLLKVVPSSCCETCLTTSDDGNEIISIKEETSDTQEGEVPVRVSLPIIMAKRGVSHVCVSITHLLAFTYFLNPAYIKKILKFLNPVHFFNPKLQSVLYLFYFIPPPPTSNQLSIVPCVSLAVSVNFAKKGELQASLATGNFGPVIEHLMQLLMKLLLDETPEGV
jgi:hypothetical protein